VITSNPDIPSMSKLNADFRSKYGPWAAVSGASDGTGRAFTHQVAANGIHCVIIARREVMPAELADEIRSKYGVECVPAAIDLSSPDAFGKIVGTVGAREVGLFVSNAGSDPNGAHFLDRTADRWIDLVNRNVITNMRCCHHFGGLMRQRRRGGLLLVGSAAGYGGSRFMAVYSATKAFVWCLAESLWAELRPHGVDVLYIALVATDTPFLQRLLEEKGQKQMRSSSPDDVAKRGLANLAKGPVFDMLRLLGLRGVWRRLRVLLISYLGRRVFGQ
jgi:short-subunit dehydrogenase